MSKKIVPGSRRKTETNFSMFITVAHIYIYLYVYAFNIISEIRKYIHILIVSLS